MIMMLMINDDDDGGNDYQEMKLNCLYFLILILMKHLTALHIIKIILKSKKNKVKLS